MQEFFNSLTKFVKGYSKIIISTHKNMDLDGFSSALCLYNIYTKMGKECYIVLNEVQTNDTIIRSFEKLNSNSFNILYKDEFSKFDFDGCLTIVLDCHRTSLFEIEEIIDKCFDIIVIDHHIKSSEYIKNTKLMYINTNVSSVAQIITSYSRYMNYIPDTILATLLLAAIEVDTNGFKFKTTEYTYETAAYLTKIGADTIVKQEILRESRESYLEHQIYIERSYQINSTMILCEIDDRIVTAKDLAVIADSLLQFQNMEASFCIGKLKENTYGISARSLGNIDVEAIMCKLGGGGHVTEAATRVENTTIDEVKNKLIEIINGG